MRKLVLISILLLNTTSTAAVLVLVFTREEAERPHSLLMIRITRRAT